jgi:hypothetical protein
MAKLTTPRAVNGRLTIRALLRDRPIQKIDESID